MDWNHVLKSITKNEQMSLKKLCIMNEVEITPGKQSTEIRSKDQNVSEKKAKSLTGPSGDFEVIVIRDDADIVNETHDPNI